MRASALYSIIFLCFCMSINSAFASECYFYHTTKNYKIVQKEGRSFIEYTELDPNGITIVHYQLTGLKNQFKGNIKELSNMNETIVFSDDEKIYAVPTGSGYNGDYKVIKIAAAKEISEIIDGRILLYKNGKTQLFGVSPYADNPDYRDLRNLPRSATLLTSTTDALLLKNDKHVFLYDIENDTAQIIPKLDAKSVVFKPSPEPYEAHFLYDDNTFYLLDDGLFSFTDVTADFSGYKISFFSVDFIIGNYLQQVYLKDTANNILWIYIKAGIDLDNGENAHFYPLKNARFVNDKLAILHYKNEYYLSGWNAVYDYNRLNISAVKSIQDLVPFPFGEYIYDDGNSLYMFDYDNSKLFPLSKLLSDKAVYYPPIASYMHGTSSFFDDNGIIRIVTADFSKIVKEILHNTPVKNLKVAYAFDDKIFIEDTLIASIADYETLTFLKSVAYPVQPCDGDGQIQIVVNYSYFFKDKNSYYEYKTGDKGLKRLTEKEVKYNELNLIVTGASANGLKESSFPGRIKFLIAAAALLAAASLAWMFKKKLHFFA